jgi:hypothetical protein
MEPGWYGVLRQRASPGPNFRMYLSIYVIVVVIFALLQPAETWGDGHKKVDGHTENIRG